MLNDIDEIREGLIAVPAKLKSGQVVSAVEAVREGARLFDLASRIRREQDLLSSLMESASVHLQSNDQIQRVFPETIEYVPGQEQRLMERIDRLMSILEEPDFEKSAELPVLNLHAEVEKGCRALRDGEVDEARRIFGRVVESRPDNGLFYLAIGTEFLRANLFADAARYLEVAAGLLPHDSKVLNLLGISRRRLRRYDDAESAFLHALKSDPSNPTLYFNVGRLYVDLEQWAKAAYYANMALNYRPDFVEAEKLAEFANSKAKSTPTTPSVDASSIDPSLPESLHRSQ